MPECDNLTPVVTVVCFTYNHKKYIRRTLKGFISQKTTFPFEIIVHDDASTDGTREIVEEFELKYPKIIKPIYQKFNTYHLQEPRIYKYILPVAMGKYIALCEGDDYWIDNNKLQQQYEYIENHRECSLVTHDAWMIKENYLYKYLKDATNYNFSFNNGIIPSDEIIRNHMIVMTCSMFFRKDYFIENREFLIRLPEYDYVLKTMLATEGSVYAFSKKMAVYRKNAEGSWNSKAKKNKNILINHNKKAIEVLKMIDKYRDYKYTDAIQENIRRREFYIAKLNFDFEMMKLDKFEDLYQKIEKKSLLKMHVKKLLRDYRKFFFHES